MRGHSRNESWKEGGGRVRTARARGAVAIYRLDAGCRPGPIAVTHPHTCGMSHFPYDEGRSPTGGSQGTVVEGLVANGDRIMPYNASWGKTL